MAIFNSYVSLPTVTPPHPWLGPGLGTLWPPQRQARRDAWVAQHPDAMLLSIGLTFLDIQFLKMRHPLTTIHFFVCHIYIYIIYTCIYYISNIHESIHVYIYVCVTHIHPVLSSIISIECCCSSTVGRSSSRGATDPDLAFQHPPNPGSSVANCIRSSVETPWPDVPSIQGRKGRLTLISCFFHDFLGCSLTFYASPLDDFQEIGMIFQKWNCFGIMCPIVCWTSVLFSRAN